MSKTHQTHTELTIHRCHAIRVSRHYPNINNAIGIEILSEDTGIEVLMFGLDRKTTHRLVSIWGDEQTTIDHAATREEDDVAA